MVEQISPGIHSMSAEAYHAAAGIRRSMLEWIAPPRTPAHFKAKFIDKLIPDVETPAMRLGTITHRAILEADTMDGAVHIKPDDMSFATKEGKAWRAEHEDRPIILVSERKRTMGMRDAVWSHPVASRILKSSDFERSLFADDDGLQIKSRFDALPRKGNVIADIKTCESADRDEVDRAIWNYKLYRQAAFYLRVAALLGLDRTNFIFIFVESEPPYCVCCYEVEDVVMQAGRNEVARDLQVIRNCYESGKWPGHPETVQVASVPAYALKAMEQLV